MLLEAEGDTYEIEPLFEVVITKMFELFRLYEEQGFSAIKYLWEKNCLMIGRKVELREPGYQEKDGDRGKVQGKLEGIDDSGAIVISNQKNEKRSYVSGELACFWP